MRTRQHEYNTDKIDLLGFNGTFSTNRLYRAFEKHVTFKSETNGKVDNVTFWEYI